MSTKSLSKSGTRSGEMFPSVFDDFFRSWNERLGGSGTGLMGRTSTVPAVNVSENQNDYIVSVAAPGLNKNDFNIDIEGNMLTISCEKEETREDERQTRREYNYSSFTRSFTLPEEVMKDKIEATYHDGVLKIVLPKKEEAKKAALSKHISVK
jgi:HSP20 family protein